MKLEILIVLILVVTFLSDFIDAFKKSDLKGSLILYEDGKIKNDSSFNLKSYFLKRKKNFTFSLLLICFLKVLVHYGFSPLTSKINTGEKTGYRIIDGKDYKYKILNATQDVTLNFREHIISSETGEWVLFTEKPLLFAPVILFYLIVVWFFNDKIKTQ